MTALPKIRRRILFYASALVFFLLAPLLILYSLGYTFDIQRRVVEETGGIFVKTNLTGFTVSLNDGTIRKHSLLTRGLLLNNLTPGQYRLRVEKEGYQPWEKMVMVTQFSVREIRDVVLLPDPLTKEDVALWGAHEDLERVFTSPQARYMAIALRNTATGKRSVIFFKTSENKIIGRFPVADALQEITWNVSENTALLAFGEQTRMYTQITLSGTTPVQTPFFNKPIGISGDTALYRVTGADIKKIRFGSETDSFVMLAATGTLLFWNTATTSAAVLAKEVGEFEVLGDDVLFIAKNGFAARQSLRDGTTVNLGRKGYVLSGAPIEVVRSQDGDIFLKDGADGLFFSPRGNNEEFALLETGVRDMALDSEEKKLFFMKQNAIGVFHLKDNEYQSFEKRGEKTILFQPSDTTFLGAAWYTEDDAHIFLNTSSGVFLLDVDIRGGPRIAKLDTMAAKKIFWDQNAKKLYLIRDTGIKTLAIE